MRIAHISQKIRIRPGKACLFLFFIFCCASAQTLPQAQQILFINNPEIQIAEIRYLKSLISVAGEKSVYYPVVDAFAGYGYQSKPNRLVADMDMTPAVTALSQRLGLPVSNTNPVIVHIDEAVGDLDRFEMGVDIRYQIFDGFTRKYNVLAAEASSASYCMELMAVKSRFSLKLGLMYFAWELASEKVDVQKNYIEQVSEYMIQVRNLHIAGMEPASRELEAVARLEFARTELLSAENTVDSLLIEIADFLQLSVGEVSPRPYSYNIPVDIAENMPRGDRNETAILDSSVSRLRYAGRALMGMRMPSLYVAAGYRLGNPGIVMGGNDLVDWGVAGINFKWTIYDGQKNWSRREQIKYEINILKKERGKQLALWEKSAAQYRLQVEKAHRMKSAAQLALKAAEAYAEDLKNALSAGAASSADYLNALSSVVGARFSVAAAENLRKTASLRLAYTLGENMEF